MNNKLLSAVIPVGPRILFAPMDAKRIFRGPLLWIVLAVLLVLLGSQLFTGSSGPKSVDTWQAIRTSRATRRSQRHSSTKEQRIELTLQDGRRLRLEYIDGQGVKLQEQLQAKKDSGQLQDGYNVEVPRENLLVSLLISLLPVAIIIFLLFFFAGPDAGRRLEDHELRQGQDQSHQ